MRHGNLLTDIPHTPTISIAPPIDMDRLIMTDAEVDEEKRYRFEERLAILLGEDVPTDDQFDLAIKESEEWAVAYYLTRL